MESYYLGCNVNQYCILFGSTDYSGASESFSSLSNLLVYPSKILVSRFFIVIPLIILNKTRRFFAYFVKFALLKYSF